MANEKRPWSPAQMIWSALAAIVVWSALGFSWFGFGFGWVTPGNSAQAAANAVTDELATICVAQAKSDVDITEGLKKLTNLTSWKQREFVEESGWATVPGSDSINRGVAERCATQLVAEAKKSAS